MPRPTPVSPKNSRPPPAAVAFVVSLWDKTLNSVYFGIFLMVALGLFVAVGSGFPALRAWFEMSDPEFFNAWPMWVLAGLLVANLLTVSLNRIPFTLPRLGVWTIHAGIVVLIFGMTFHFSQKTEGLTLIRTGEQVDWYYDAHERALYATAGKRKAVPMSLDGLPRFNSYEDASYLAGRGLAGLEPTFFTYDEQTRQGREMNASDALGLGGEPLVIDVIGYHPYALTQATYSNGMGELTGLKVTLRDPQEGHQRSSWIVGEQPGHPRDDADDDSFATLRIRHLHRGDDLTGELLASAARVGHELNWSVGSDHHHDHAPGEHEADEVVSGSVTLEPGDRKAFGDTGYEVEAVAYLPGFPLSGSGEPVDLLELIIHPPADSPHGKPFRRYVIDGQDNETDFILGIEGSGPKGQRQTEVVDANLHLHYALNDALDLLPRAGEDERHTLLTKENEPGFYHLVTRGDLPARLEQIDAGLLELAINGKRRDPATGEVTDRTLDLDVERADAVMRSDWVQDVPLEQRDSGEAQAGINQVVTLRVSRGDWSETVHVPYTQWIDQIPWQPSAVTVPGLADPLRFQLGNTRRPIPARVRLDDFELVPYAGDFTANSAMRDFKSNLSIEPRGGVEHEATVSLNRPHYLNVPVAGPLGAIWPKQSWLLFQSQWDPENQAFTVLGVGNRPGVFTMTLGCVMIVLGLLFAFYVKPVIINRRKARALAAVGR